ncbi:MAG: F0F1 ATP synthase subunit gamma [Candidatus Omnitrophica bacterium]|nr:F0F1 ATP synthase subunit gamma [Candidatus Omnitrophota bacterium]
MATVKEIKEELQFDRELKGLLEMMRDIAVFQFRTLEGKGERFVRFYQLLEKFFGMASLKRAPHHFVNPRTDRLAMVMITSNEGFMGGLNLKVINTSLSQKGAEDAALIIVGERGQRYLKEIGREFIGFKRADFAERYNLVLELRDYITNGIRKEEFGRVRVVYPRPLSFMVQKIEVRELLPIAKESESQRVRGAEYKGETSIIIESPLEEIVEYLVEVLLLQKFMEILEDSKLSEFAARAIHLEKGSRELEEKERLVLSQYFRAYHGLIDKNTRELFSAQLIMRRT